MTATGQHEETWKTSKVELSFIFKKTSHSLHWIKWKNTEICTTTWKNLACSAIYKLSSITKYASLKFPSLLFFENWIGIYLSLSWAQTVGTNFQ